MALFVRQDHKRSELQEKLAADLKNKLQSGDVQSADTSPAILDDEHPTRPAGVIIAILVGILFIVVVAVMVLSRPA